MLRQVHAPKRHPAEVPPDAREAHIQSVPMYGRFEVLLASLIRFVRRLVDPHALLD